MPVFSSSEQAAAIFAELFRILLTDDDFTSRMRAGNLSLRLVHTRPDVQLYVDAEQVQVGEAAGRAAITVKMSCDTAHALWSGRLLMPLALATGRVRISGSVAKVLEFVPILRPAFDRYPEIVAASGIHAG